MKVKQNSNPFSMTFGKAFASLVERDFRNNEMHTSKVADIRENINMNFNTFNVYRKRLIKKGVVRAADYGHLSLTLPRFDEFIKRQ